MMNRVEMDWLFSVACWRLLRLVKGSTHLANDGDGSWCYTPPTELTTHFSLLYTVYRYSFLHLLISSLLATFLVVTFSISCLFSWTGLSEKGEWFCCYCFSWFDIDSFWQHAADYWVGCGFFSLIKVYVTSSDNSLLFISFAFNVAHDAATWSEAPVILFI